MRFHSAAQFIPNVVIIERSIISCYHDDNCIPRLCAAHKLWIKLCNDEQCIASFVWALIKHIP